MTLDVSRLGKPTDNGFIEAFNSKLRSECLNAHWILTVADTPRKVEALVQRLQRDQAPRRDRMQRADRHPQSRWRNQPVTGITAGKFQHPAVQRRGAAQPKDGLWIGTRDERRGRSNPVKLLHTNTCRTWRAP